MKILLLTDSLSLPRSDNGNSVSYEDTYPALLRSQFPHSVFIDSAIGGATIYDLYKQIFYYKTVNPDVVIMHCGIVDCAPRAWRSLGRKILVKSGLKLNGLTRFMRKYRGLKMTPPDKFDAIASKIKSEFKNTPVYAIGILPASEAYEEQVPGISKSIQHYNRILSKHFILIDNSDFAMSGIMNDHHHLNVEGQLLISKKVGEIIRSLERK